MIEKLKEKAVLILFGVFILKITALLIAKGFTIDVIERFYENDNKF